MITTAMQSTSGKSTPQYRSTLRERQAAQTRAQVVTAATQQFAADGYLRTTVAKIATVPGCPSKPSAATRPKPL